MSRVFAVTGGSYVPYILKSANSDLSGGADFNKVLSLGTQTASTISFSLGSHQTRDSYGYTPAGEPGLSGARGAFQIGAEVTTENNHTQISLAVARVNLAGAQQAISGFSSEQQATIGPKSFTVGANLGTWANTDRLRQR